MEWWQYLIISTVTVSIGAFLAYFFNRLGIKTEKEAIEQRQFQSAIVAMLGEILANESIAKRPWTGKQLPFLMDMWSVYKPQISHLPEEIIQQIEELYLDVILANAIVSQDLHKLAWGSGYLDNQYRDMCKQIREKTTPLIIGLNNYLGK